MVAIVVVSHSAELAASVVDFARAMGGDSAPMEPAGGVEDGIGTDFELIGAAIDRAAQASGGDGVLVLMDLGSAVQTAQMVVELGGLDAAQVRLVAAPLVEGAVAASINAGGGGSLDEVAAEARKGLHAKQVELGEVEQERAEDLEGDLQLRNREGIHARPAKLVNDLAGRHDAQILLWNATNGRGPAPAGSYTDVMTLGAKWGHVLRVEATGPDAGPAEAELRELVEAGFGEDIVDTPPTGGEPASPVRARTPEPEPSAAPAAGATLHGIPASPGLADAPVRTLGGAVALPEGDAEDPAGEVSALEDAIETVRRDLEATRDDLAGRGRTDEAAIFDAQVALLDDEALVGVARRAIRERRSTGARAIHDAAGDVAARFEELDDAFLRERAADVRDVGRRIVRALLGEDGGTAGEAGAIIVTDELLPGDAATLDPERVAGVATAHGGATGHAAIIARSLGIPTVVGLGPALLAVPDGTRLLLDGGAGTVLVDPDPETAARHEAQAAAEADRRERAARRASEPAVTRDGTRIEVAANLGDVAGADRAVALGAEGVGLLRSEFLFLDRAELPDEDEQAEAYATVARALDGRPLIIRTLDVGADKPLPALPAEPEANPFLGRRGIRLQLARPELLTAQLRAVLRTAAEHAAVKVMFPMVATLGEVRAARAVLEEARMTLGIDAPLEVGVMVEVPAVAVQAERFAAELDFFSIGTNDLAQYAMAAERGNEHVAGLAAGPVPAVLRLVDMTVRGAAAHGRWVGVCGELAGDVDGARLLAGLGVTELSMAPPRIADVKEALRDLDLGAARAAAERAMAADTADAARAIAAAL